MLSGLLTIKGRDPRLSWWLIQLCAIVGPWLLFASLYLIFMLTHSSHVLSNILSWVLVSAAVVIYIWFFWISIAASIRRLHDLNLSGWWFLGYMAVALLLGLLNETLVSVVVIAMWIHLGFFPGTSGRNQFGLPKSGERSNRAMQTRAV